MRILCAIGQQGGPKTIERVKNLIGNGHELVLLHVIDTGPRHGLEGFLHRPGARHGLPLNELTQRIDEAEESAGKAALEESRQAAEKLGFHVQTSLERGEPGQVVVKVAQEKDCQLIALEESEGVSGRPRLGPESVGPVARYVLDHATSDILFLRGD